MIPKTIHYCWFGQSPLPDLTLKCIASWKKYCPGYEIKEWNELNFDIQKYRYTEQAYANKKYAFVSDVARFDIIYDEGGIYLDTDVELIRPIDDLLSHHAFTGYDRKGQVATGLIFGAEKNSEIAKIMTVQYAQLDYLSNTKRETLQTVVTLVTGVLKNSGISIDGEYSENSLITLYPWECFDPYDYEKHRIDVTENTYSIHHYAGSWLTDLGRQYVEKQIEFDGKYGRFGRVLFLLWEYGLHPLNLVNYIRYGKLWRQKQ